MQSFRMPIQKGPKLPIKNSSFLTNFPKKFLNKFQNNEIHQNQSVRMDFSGNKTKLMAFLISQKIKVTYIILQQLQF